jgi:hypothetical protein
MYDYFEECPPDRLEPLPPELLFPDECFPEERPCANPVVAVPNASSSPQIKRFFTTA